MYDNCCLKILRCLSWYIAKANQKRVYPLYMNFLLSLTAHCTRVKVAIRNWTLKLVQCPDLGFSYQRARRRGISGDFTLLQTHSLRIRPWGVEIACLSKNMITILISTEEYDLVSLRSTVRRRFGGKPVKVMGRGGGRGELVFLRARPTHQRDRG